MLLYFLSPRLSATRAHRDDHTISMVRLWLAALVAGVCATDQSVRDGAAPLNDHTEQTSAWSHTPSTNAGECIGHGRDSAMRAVHCGGDGDYIKRSGLDKLKASLKELRAGRRVLKSMVWAAQRYCLGYLYTGPLGHRLEAAMTSLIKAGVSVDAKDDDGKTVLMHAAKRGHVAVVARLIEAGVSVDAKDPAGNTALHYAATHGHEATVAMLIEAGASVEASELLLLIGHNIKWRAAEHGYYEVLLLTARYFPTIVYKQMLACFSMCFSMLASLGYFSFLQTPLSTMSIAALLEFLRLHFQWSAILDTALDRASATHVIVPLSLLPFLDFQGCVLPVNLLHEARVALLSLMFFRGVRDLSLRTLLGYREDGKCAAAKAVLNDAIYVMTIFALILIVWCMALFVSICLRFLGQLAVLLLGGSEMMLVTMLEYAGGMLFLLLGPFHRQEITDWVLGFRTSMSSIRRRLFRRPVPIRPPSADDVCPICLDAFLPDLAPVQCAGRASDAHGLWQFAASEWQLTSESAAASSMGNQDDRPDQAIEYCRWGCGQPVHQQCMRTWTCNHRNQCVICQAWWS